MVRQADAPELDLTSKARARFKSKEWQRVLKEQKAKKSGITENRRASKNLSLESLKPQIRQKDKEGPGSQEKELDLTGLPYQFRSFGQSTLSERISDDIDYGDFTALNTDKHLFYSFYSRVQERLYPRWVSHIRSSIIQLNRTGKSSQIPRGEWISQIEIHLDENGNYQHAIVLKSSGLKLWDQAAIIAFRQGAPYVHPPDEMIDEDNRVRLRYSFHVFWDPVRFRSLR